MWFIYMFYNDFNYINLENMYSCIIIIIGLLVCVIFEKIYYVLYFGCLEKRRLKFWITKNENNIIIKKLIVYKVYNRKDESDRLYNISKCIYIGCKNEKRNLCCFVIGWEF